jgi:hypothetical protein
MLIRAIAIPLEKAHSQAGVLLHQHHLDLIYQLQELFQSSD